MACHTCSLILLVYGRRQSWNRVCLESSNVLIQLIKTIFSNVGMFSLVLANTDSRDKGLAQEHKTIIV